MQLRIIGTARWYVRAEMRKIGVGVVVGVVRVGMVRKGGKRTRRRKKLALLVGMCDYIHPLLVLINRLYI